MNILFFSRLFFPHIGGVEKHVFEISRILMKKGHRILVVTEQHQKDLKFKEKVKDIEVYRIPNLKENWFKKFKIWKWLWQNRGLIEKADVIHCHDVFFWYLPFRFLFFRKPVYTTFHGYEKYPLKKRQIVIHKISEKLSFGNICVGDFMKKWYSTKPNFVTYGGVDIVKSEKLPARNASRSDAGGKVKIAKGAVFIGRLDEQTGIKTYIRAVNLIKNCVTNFEFGIIGDGKFRREIEKDFKVLGFRKNPQEYFRQYRFAFVSRYLSILEAMAARRLVFAVYDNPLKEDYLKMASFSKLINIFSSERDLARKIIHFLKNPKEETKLVNEGYSWVKKSNWEKVTEIYLSLWTRTFLKREE